jgi:signal transduction histidine kinase
MREQQRVQSPPEPSAAPLPHDAVARLATLGMLAATSAHEVRNVLTPALAYAQLALARLDEREFLQKAIAAIVHGIESASGIIEATLDFAGRGAEDGSDQHEPTNILQVVHDAFKCIARDPARDRIKVEVNVPCDLAVAMRRLALQQVILNLVGNAINAMWPRGGGTLLIEARETDAGAVAVAVQDSGPGLPKAVAERLFQPFLSKQIPNRSGGCGLGLAVCKDLVERAGGAICAGAAPGGGARFEFTVPAARGALAPAVT